MNENKNTNPNIEEENNQAYEEEEQEQVQDQDQDQEQMQDQEQEQINPLSQSVPNNPQMNPMADLSANFSNPEFILKNIQIIDAENVSIII